MAKPGQPTKYKEEYCEQATKLLAQGKAICHLAREFDVCVDTINEWRRVHPKFSAAVKKGVDHSEAKWCDDAEDNMANKNFNAALWYMNMKNRFGWRDKKEVQQDISLVASEVQTAIDARNSYKEKAKKEF